MKTTNSMMKSPSKVMDNNGPNNDSENKENMKTNSTMSNKPVLESLGKIRKNKHNNQHTTGESSKSEAITPIQITQDDGTIMSEATKKA